MPRAIKIRDKNNKPNLSEAEKLAIRAHKRTGTFTFHTSVAVISKGLGVKTTVDISNWRGCYGSAAK